MISSKSRYSKSRFFSPLQDGSASFQGVRPREIGAAEGVIEHEVKVGDRLDQLARYYYNNDRMWYRIMDANPEFFYGQSFPETAKDGDEQEAIPSVLLLKNMEGSVILIPKLTE
ncbi:MAG: hypothetical protein ACSHX0_07830 [Akkermansiaceae bacterium]